MRKILTLATMLAPVAASAADNPMWRSGLAWSCDFASVMTCERSRDCVTRPVSGAIRLDYRENEVVDPGGTVRPIKRHYVQAVAGSPIPTEVKVELTDNEVLWLSPVDGAGTFSDIWVGALLSPRPGVILQELRPLACRPVP